jgi:hypothetical protein
MHNKYSTVTGDRVPTSALASEPRAHEGAQMAYLRTPVSQVRCEGDKITTKAAVNQVAFLNSVMCLAPPSARSRQEQEFTVRSSRCGCIAVTEVVLGASSQ